MIKAIIFKNVAKLQQFVMRTFFISILLSIFLISCTSKDEKSEIFEKKRINPNADERAREFADKNPLFNSGNKNSGGNFQFASSNVLWRASLETLDGLPLSNSDYSGGVIITDWYGQSSNEQIKITVRFLSDELATTSLKIISHIKSCKNQICNTTASSEKFNQEIKNKILNKARTISIADAKKNKK